MRRLICFLLYIVMMGAGGTPLVTIYFNYRGGRISLWFLATCGFLLLFGMYLLLTDFVLYKKTVARNSR